MSLATMARFSFRDDGTILLFGVVLLGLMTAWTIWSPLTLYPLAFEDGLLENLQFVLYLGGAISFLHFYKMHKHYLRFGGILTIIWALALVVMAGEEISWGQRIFGFITPKNMIEANKQAEFNLHNLRALYSIYGTDSRPMFLIEMGLGCALPLFALTSQGGRMCRYLSMPVPPIALAPLFRGTNLFGHLFATHFLVLGFERTVTPEISEFLLSAALCASGFFITRRPDIAFGQAMLV